MSSSESDGKSDWNDLLINAIRRKQGTGKIVTEENRLHDVVVALDQGADINTRDCKSGNTALHIAVRRGFQEIVIFLRQKGASTDIPNLKGETAITLAENHGAREILRILQKPILHREASAVCEETRASDYKSLNVNNAEDQPSTARDNENITRHDYRKSKKFAAGATLKRSWPGIFYQLKHLTFTLQCALQQKHPYFFLATEMIEAEKFDDIVLLYKDKSGKQVGRFVQIKHGNDQDATISAQQLLEAAGNFSVPNYFKYWRKIKENRLFKDVVSRHMILCTNIGIDLDDLKINGISCIETGEPDKSFELKSRVKRTAWYKIVAEQECNPKVYKELRAMSHIHDLATQFVHRIHDGKPMSLEIDIFQYYHVALANQVFDPKSGKFHDKFIKNVELSPPAQRFRGLFLAECKEIFKNLGNDASEEIIWINAVKRLGELEKPHRDFGKRPNIEPHPQLAEIDKLSDRFVKLLENAAKTHTVKIVTGTLDKVFADNVDKLCGHVLIKDEQIKFSSQFLNDDEQSPGNIGDFKIALKTKLQNRYHQLSLFEFEIKIPKVCKKRQSLTEHSVENDASDEKTWIDVLQRLGKLEKPRNDLGEPPNLEPHSQLTDIDKLSDCFVGMLEKAVKTYTVKIVTGTSPREGAEHPNKVIADNVDKLIGHVLVEKDNNIKFSSQFLEDGKPLPGNIGDFKTALMEKFSDTCQLSKFEFEIKNSKVCTERQLLTKNELPVDYIEDREISIFLEEFTLAVTQPNEDEMDEAIKMKVDADGRFNVQNTELLGHALKNKIIDWFVKRSERGNEKEYIWGKVGEEFLENLDQAVCSFKTTGLSSRYCERLEAFNLRFKSGMPLVERFLSEDVSHQTSHRILQLLTSRNTLLTALRFYDTLRRIPKYKKMDSFIFVELDDFRLPLVSKSVLSTFNSLQYSDLLVVDCGPNDIEKYIKELCTPLCQIIERHSNKKIIFITQTNTRSLTPFLTSHGINIEQISEIADDKHDDYSFRNLADETRNELLEKPVTRFQGHETNTSFGELMGIRTRGHIEEAELQNLSKIIDSNTLIDLISKDEIHICNNFEQWIEKDYYVNREIRRRVIIKKDIFQDKKIPDLFAISEAHEELRNMLLKTTAEFSSMPDVAQKITMLDRTREEEQFEALCKKHMAIHNIHWLKKHSDEYIWEKSKGDITHLVKYRVTGGSDDLYANKLDSKDLTKELTMVDDEITAHDGPVIVSSVAGMGKSTMLTYLSRKLKEKSPDMLVIKINLNDHVQALKEVKEKLSYDLRNETEAIDFLVTDLFKHETDLARKVIRRMMKNKCKVALIFDGFDEISPNYEVTVNNLLETLAKHGMKKLFVATRHHTRKSLEMKLKVFAYDIQPFQSKNQEEFLNNFIKNDKARIEKAQALLEKLGESIDERTNGFTGIPLHTKMIAEILRNPTLENIESFEKLVDFHDENPNGSEKVDLIYLYECFVEMKFSYCFDKRGAEAANIDVIIQRQSELERFIETHKKLALDALFEEDKVKEFPPITPDSKMEIERYGIITQFSDDGRPQFGHRSYAEYFAATYVVEMVKKVNLNESIQKIFVADILLGDNYQTMRAFINCLWTEPHGDVFGVGFGEFRLDEYRGSHNRTILHVAAAENNDQIIQMFLNYLDLSFGNEKALSNAEEVSTKTGCSHALEMRKENGDGTVGLSNNDGMMLGQVVTSIDNTEGEKLLSHKELAIVDSPDDFGDTPLYLAAWSCQLAVLKHLCDRGANVNSVCSDGLTPLHAAVYRGQLDVIEYLLSKGADVNSASKDGRTPLYVAAQERQSDVVKYLLSKGANMNSETEYGWKPLHSAAFHREFDVVCKCKF